MKAIWNGTVVAQSDDTVVVESNHYFPREAIVGEYFTDSTKLTHCPWKGDASYLSITVGEDTNPDAAWFYATPKDAAKNIEGRVAFRREVLVTE
jgi:uncharacterized protein (DUF427 family)